MENLILFSQLRLIESATDFFNADKILYNDAVDVSNMSSNKRYLLRKHHSALVYKKKTFLPVSLKGSPQNLLLRSASIQTSIGEMIICPFEGKDLESVLKQGKVFDISGIYTVADMPIGHPDNIEFIFKKYVEPYV